VTAWYWSMVSYNAGDLVASEGAFKLDEQALVAVKGGDALEIGDGDADAAKHRE
jgi:hypothetical protein